MNGITNNSMCNIINILFIILYKICICNMVLMYTYILIICQIEI